MPGKVWVCTVCGYVHHGNEPPESCPVCGAPAGDFDPHAEETSAESAGIPAAKRWRCQVCGYVHDGDQPPESCPVCGAPAEEFEPLNEPAPEGASGAAAEDGGRLVIIGGGIAGVSAAEAYRKAAPDAEIVLLSAEADLPYYRLNLTRWLAGEVEEDALPLHPEDWYGAQRIELRRGARATALDLEAGTVAVEGSEAVSFDRLLLACGSHAFRPPFDGAGAEGVFVLRTRSDARGILDRIGGGDRLVVIGGGVLGLETAGGLAQRGVEVELLENHASLMPRQLTPNAGRRLARHLEGIGVTVRHEAQTRTIRANDGLTVELEGGDSVAAGTVVLATGVRPNTQLARKAGLPIDRGIPVDNALRAGRERVLAAGDVAEHNGTLYGLWAPALYQGRIAAMNAAGQPTEFGGMPPATLVKVLGVPLLSVGTIRPEDGSYTTLEEETDERYAWLVLRDGRLVGALVMGDEQAGADAREAIESGRDLSGELRGGATAADLLGAL